jgi:hypothetical protein
MFKKTGQCKRKPGTFQALETTESGLLIFSKHWKKSFQCLESTFAKATADRNKKPQFPDIGTAVCPSTRVACSGHFSLSAKSGAPARIRTWNLLVRSQILYPVELRVHLDPPSFSELRRDKSAECSD